MTETTVQQTTVPRNLNFGTGDENSIGMLGVPIGTLTTWPYWEVAGPPEPCECGGCKFERIEGGTAWACENCGTVATEGEVVESPAAGLLAETEGEPVAGAILE
jgi:hypothetical protein